MKHIVFYSGGLGSWATAKRVIDRYGKEDVICLFTDTLIEDDDLYRFLLETTQEMYGVEQTDLIERTKHIPETSHETMEDRKLFLKQLSEDTNKRNPNFIWINDGRDPWDVFKDVRFLGNSRLANCSHELKQKMSQKWIKENFTSEECTLYLGIDWTEEHRVKAPKKNWAPYRVEFPMCEEPLWTKIDMAKLLEQTEIERPKLYEQGFSHNNCGGFCVRAGQGHFAQLWEVKPRLYMYHEEREQEMRHFLGRDVSILSKTKTIDEWVEPKKYDRETLEKDSELYDQFEKGMLEAEAEEVVIPGYYRKRSTKMPFTLKELRHELERGGEQVDMFDIGGCGCFVDF
ncbi:hypothetical protein LCM20_16735 [Halobacillus litoralis]|uniref:hypothetical protein n=1 Tax=Halobacillus litoralis TaxID=45668 RepID=UPI001CD3A37A|nr:hypothetical protein [Halobacillus litoralis]MCA0972257.1 hypothetical protein [Halobacillus litoralis]